MPQPRPRRIITPATIKLARDRPARSLELEKDVEGDRDQDEDERQDQRLILGPAEMLPQYMAGFLVTLAWEDSSVHESSLPPIVANLLIYT
jgi:hypothetical protein